MNEKDITKYFKINYKNTHIFMKIIDNNMKLLNNGPREMQFTRITQLDNNKWVSINQIFDNMNFYLKGLINDFGKDEFTRFDKFYHELKKRWEPYQLEKEAVKLNLGEKVELGDYGFTIKRIDIERTYEINE